jgi:hypothetical protein
MAYGALRAAMAPILICCRYPEESYRIGEALSLPLFVVNDLPRALGPLAWTWELRVGQTLVRQGSGETEIAGDSVVEIGRVEARLDSAGPARLRLYLRVEGGADATNSYEFYVRRGRSWRRGSSARVR